MNGKIIEAAMEYLESAMYTDGADKLNNVAWRHLFVLCNAAEIAIADAIAVEKSILRHFVKLYGVDGWDAYCNFRAA